MFKDRKACTILCVVGRVSPVTAANSATDNGRSLAAIASRMPIAFRRLFTTSGSPLALAAGAIFATSAGLRIAGDRPLAGLRIVL